METKVCKGCGRELPIENFSTGGANGTRFVQNYCKECMAKRKSEGHARKKAELQSKTASEVEQAKKQRLSEFTPRELMEELKRRGYDGELVYTEVKKIGRAHV